MMMAPVYSHIVKYELDFSVVPVILLLTFGQKRLPSMRLWRWSWFWLVYVLLPSIWVYENHVVVVVVLAWSVSACFSYHGSLNPANKTRQHKARHILDYDESDNNNGMKNRVRYQTMNQNYDIFSFYFDRKVM